MRIKQNGSTTRRTFLCRALAASATAALPLSGRRAEARSPSFSPNTSVFATGLDNPRGLRFGPDGFLYVAEGGQGGTLSTVGQCDQVPAPIGPYTGGYSAHISRIDSNGNRTIFVDGLPSTQSAPGAGSVIMGVADVEFVDGNLYALLAGAGCSHGLAGTANGILRINNDGSTALIADLSAFQKANPVAHPNPADFEPDGTWYSMVAVRGVLYAVEPNHGEMDKVTTDGQVTRVIDISASQGHVVPTSVAYKGNFHVGNLGTFPMSQGGENIYKITPSGEITTEFSGLTAVVGVAFDQNNCMYALESFTGQPFPGPSAAGTGAVIRVKPNGDLDTVASGLTFPTAMTFGPDGLLYVSNNGFGLPPGSGQVVRIQVTEG